MRQQATLDKVLHTMRKYEIVNKLAAGSFRSSLPSRCICSQPSHPGENFSSKTFFCQGIHILPPGVPVLVSDLFLHLCISEGLQEGAPDVGLALVPDANDVQSLFLAAP